MIFTVGARYSSNRSESHSANCTARDHCLHNSFTKHRSNMSRKTLNLAEKVNAIKRVEGGESCTKVAKSLGVGKTQIQETVKRKISIFEEYETYQRRNDSKRFKKCRYDDVDTALWDWFSRARARNIPISGPILKERALHFAASFEQEGFKASNGWLQKFCSRHNISLHVLSGK